jgi:hypothetical protein
LQHFFFTALWVLPDCRIGSGAGIYLNNLPAMKIVTKILIISTILALILCISGDGQLIITPLFMVVAARYCTRIYEQGAGQPV